MSQQPCHNSDGALSVLMPAYNERDTILEAVERVLAVPIVGEIIIVDDGSTDGTGPLIDSLTDDRVRVIHHPERKGKGLAIRTGIPYVRRPLVVIQDADLEYRPEQLPSLAAVILRGESSVVYGSRFKGRITGMQRANWIGNRLLTLITNILFHGGLTDEATCYKMFRTELLRGIPLHCTRFEFCPEVTARVLRQGIRIAEVPIDYHGRPHSEGKKVRWWDFVSAVATLLRYRFCR